MRAIEIIGGGLAGLSLATALRRAGVDVTVFEAGAYPRHRVCGEFITGLDAQTIATLGLAPVLDGALRHRELAWHLGDRTPRVFRLPHPALGISRHCLDARLAAACVDTGVQLVTNTRVDAATAKPGRVLTTGRRRGRPDWIGLKVHVSGLMLARDLEMHLGRDAYVGLARVGRDTVNVCGLFRGRQTSRPEPHVRGVDVLLAHLERAGLPGVAQRLREAEPDARSFCAVAALGFERPFDERGTIRLGDAYAMIPPFTGNGMALALQSAATALPPLLAYARGGCHWEQTCRDVAGLLRRRFRVRFASARLVHPFLLQPAGQRWLSTFARSRVLPFRALYHVLH